MFEQFKKFLKKGDKYIFIEDNKPSYVLLHYEDYEAMLKHSAERPAFPQKPKVGFADLNPTHTYGMDGASSENTEDEFIRGLSVAERYDVMPEETIHIRLEDLPL
ncbi:hypothetical protein KGQ34_02000 [Patescibacteria group bacterium]|nr:hypothetical protein [Patescibacteria group bacterium]